MKIIYTPVRKKSSAKIVLPDSYDVSCVSIPSHTYDATFLKVPDYNISYSKKIGDVVKGFFIAQSLPTISFEKSVETYKALVVDENSYSVICFKEKFAPYIPYEPLPSIVLTITTKATSSSVWLNLGSQFDEYCESDTGEVRNGYFYPNSYGIHKIYLKEYPDELTASGYPTGSLISELDGIYPRTGTYPSRLYYNNTYINKVLGNFFLKNNDWTSGTSFMFYRASNLNEIGPILKGCTRVTNLESFLDWTTITRLPDGILDDCVNLQNCKSFVNHCSNLEYVPPRMFDNCPNITMNNHFFENCSKLEYLDLGNLHRIDETFCQNCYRLQTVILRRSSVVPLNNRNAFQNNASGRYFYVPDSLVNSYKSATNWNYYSSSIKPLSEIE